MYDFPVYKCGSDLGAMLSAVGRIARCCIGLFYKIVFELRSAACFAETIVGTISRDQDSSSSYLREPPLASLEVHRKKGAA
jgi:hypothetical protein